VFLQCSHPFQNWHTRLHLHTAIADIKDPDLQKLVAEDKEADLRSCTIINSHSSDPPAAQAGW